MPGLSGVELQKRLIADGHRLPIIFVTAASNEKQKDQALRSGAVGYLQKPFREDRLIECIDAALKIGGGGNAQP